MNQYDNLEKAMAGALDDLSERVTALEAASASPAPSTRFYAVSKSEDGVLDGQPETNKDLAALLRKAATT